MFKYLNSLPSLSLPLKLYETLLQIMVYITEAGSGEKIPVPVDKDNLLPLQILERYFPGAAGLMYFRKESSFVIFSFIHDTFTLRKF